MPIRKTTRIRTTTLKRMTEALAEHGYDTSTEFIRRDSSKDLHTERALQVARATYERASDARVLDTIDRVIDLLGIEGYENREPKRRAVPVSECACYTCTTRFGLVIETVPALEPYRGAARFLADLEKASTGDKGRKALARIRAVTKAGQS